MNTARSRRRLVSQRARLPLVPLLLPYTYYHPRKQRDSQDSIAYFFQVYFELQPSLLSFELQPSLK